ncbi:MAG: glycosyltransferase family 2 protein, partial [Bacteroidales bacterium]|nr:glycosyltransferase family 2 protein [Bacteroidales bacterium]
ITIVIQIYNAAQYIERCFNSLIGQDLQDVEILCIDDGSSDDSVARLEALLAGSEKKPHFTVIKNAQNMGVSYSRNLGIKQAHGDYVIYIDSDDYVTPDYVSQLKAAIAQCDPDVVIFGFDELKRDGSIIQHAHNCPESAPVLIEKLFLNQLHNSLCNKLFRRSLYLQHNISIPADLSAFEDKAVCFKLLHYCQTVKCINKSLYIYDRSNANSVTFKKYELLVRPAVQAVDIIDRFYAQKEVSPQLRTAILANKIFVAGFAYLYGKRADYADYGSVIQRYPNSLIFHVGNFPYYYRLAVFFSQNHMPWATKLLTVMYRLVKKMC